VLPFAANLRRLILAFHAMLGSVFVVKTTLLSDECRL